jgi:uncharacterized membrane protein YgcG
MLSLAQAYGNYKTALKQKEGLRGESDSGALGLAMATLMWVLVLFIISIVFIVLAFSCLGKLKAQGCITDQSYTMLLILLILSFLFGGGLPVGLGIIIYYYMSGCGGASGASGAGSGAGAGASAGGAGGGADSNVYYF